MMSIPRLAALALVASLSLALPSASSESPPSPKEPVPEKRERGITLSQGTLSATLSSNFNLSSELVGKPVALNLDIAYGVTRRIDVGVYHSQAQLTGFWTGNGGGLCPSGEDNGCGDLYDGPIGVLVNVGLDDSLASGALSLAANGGAVIGGFDPFEISIKAGLRARYRAAAKLAIVSEPSVLVGLTERDMGNKELISVPLAAVYMIDKKLSVAAQTGIQGPREDFGDFYTIGLTGGVSYKLSRKLAVAGVVGFLNLIGSNGSADARSATLYVSANL